MGRAVLCFLPLVPCSFISQRIGWFERRRGLPTFGNMIGCVARTWPSRGIPTIPIPIPNNDLFVTAIPVPSSLLPFLPLPPLSCFRHVRPNCSRPYRESLPARPLPIRFVHKPASHQSRHLRRPCRPAGVGRPTPGRPKAQKRRDHRSQGNSDGCLWYVMLFRRFVHRVGDLTV